MAFADHFSDAANAYAKSRPSYPAELYAFIAARAPGRRLAWDCATGNGQAALGLAAHFDAVEATDASAEQVAHATPHPQVHYSVQPAERTSFPDASFDAVCVAQALHWFDIDAFHREVHRVLKAGGVIAAWGYDRMRVTPAFDVAFERTVLPLLHGYWPPENARLWGGYRGLPFPYEPVEAPPFEVELHWTLPQLLDYVGTWTGAKRYAADGHPDFLAALEPELRAAWGPEETRDVRMALHFLCGRHA